MVDRNVRATHRLRMGLRRTLSSPLGVVVLFSTALGLWTVAYEAHLAKRSPTDLASEAIGPRVAEAQGPARTAAPAIDVRPPAMPTFRAPPRLRAPFVPGTPGLEIAIEDRDGHSLDGFHAALRRAAAGQGKARLLFWGASHTAADVYTGTIRAYLQTMFGDGGAGYVLPAPPWRSYRRFGLVIDGSTETWNVLKVGAHPTEDYYGLAGVALESSTAGAWGEVRPSTQYGWSRNTSGFEVWYLEQPMGGRFDVLVDGTVSQRINTRAVDKRPGYVRFAEPDGTHTIELRAIGDSPVRVFGVVTERDGAGVVVDALGVNGSRARSHLLWNDALYREHLRRRNPDLVVLAYGTNEAGDDQPIADYERQLNDVVRRIRETLPNASCLLVGPSDRPLVQSRTSVVDRPRTAQVIETQWRVALQNGCGFFDTVAFQGGPMATVTWSELDPPYAGRDLVHFTRRGYVRLGEVMLGALLDGTPHRIPERVQLPGEDPGSFAP